MQGTMDLSLVNWVFLKCGACVLLLMHSMYTFFSFILDYLLYILKYLKTIHSRTRPPKSVPETFLQEQLKCYSKIPKHLVVIIEEEDISYHDCVKLILWCLNSGIPFVSFYSFSSAINPTSLYEVLCKRSKTSLQNIKWGNSFHKSVKEMAKKDINGYVWTPVTEVNMFSSKSVYESMENVMLSLCQQGIESDQITIDTIDKKFKTEVPLPDPCLALVFGKTFSTFGFMPWQLRVTEFSHMPTHHNLQVEDFLNSLKTYTSCDQRFGK